MSSQTKKLNLFKYDPNTDGDQTFNLDKALNKNWDEIDALAGRTDISEETKKLYGLGADATNDDIFRYVGKYDQYWWEKSQIFWVPIMTDAKGQAIFSSSHAYNWTIEYGSSIRVAADGAVEIVDKSTYTQQYPTESDLTWVNNNLRGKFVKILNDPTIIYKVGSNATFTVRSYMLTCETGTERLTHVRRLSQAEYVSDNSDSAYPKAGVSGEYYYRFIGSPLKNMHKALAFVPELIREHTVSSPAESISLSLSNIAWDSFDEIIVVAELYTDKDAAGEIYTMPGNFKIGSFDPKAYSFKNPKTYIRLYSHCSSSVQPVCTFDPQRLEEFYSRVVNDAASKLQSLVFKPAPSKSWHILANSTIKIYGVKGNLP